MLQLLCIGSTLSPVSYFQISAQPFQDLGSLDLIRRVHQAIMGLHTALHVA